MKIDKPKVAQICTNILAFKCIELKNSELKFLNC